MSVTRMFTFGPAHKNPKTGMSLGERYVVIEGETADHCRAEMLNRFGRNWAFEYPYPPNPVADIIGKYSLKELQKADWPPSSGNYRIGDKGEWIIKE